MKTKDFILREAQRKGEVRSSEVVEHLKISRQTVTQHLRELTVQNKLTKLGTTLDARYIPYDPLLARKNRPALSFKVVKRLKGLNEDRLFDQASLRLNLPRRLSGKAYRIVRYAFTEMVNNVIDHSKASSLHIDMWLGGGNFEFKVRDKGVGVYESLRRRFRLKDFYEALEHLMKGKQTTDPRRHSGQGIFFTSKAADFFRLQNGRLIWTLDNLKKDVTVEESRSFLTGTEVTFRIRASSLKDLKAVFDAFANEDYEFDKSIVMVRLSPKDGDYVSRSEAKRLVFGLEKFKRIVFDFCKVKAVGQGFADEIFRVFRSGHPSIRIESKNMNPAVKFMVERVEKDDPLQ